MKNPNLLILILSICLFMAAENLCGQSWDFIKEKDGIKIYTRKEKNSGLKTFKGETYLHAPADKVYSLLENVKNFDLWDEDVVEMKIILYERNKRIQYYLVYDLSWPVTDRDLVVDAHITIDSVTGIRVLDSRALLNVIPEKTDLIRIKKYWQKWTIIPMPDGMVHLILEGFADPAGSIPGWIYNMAITDTPLKTIKSVMEHIK